MLEVAILKDTKFSAKTKDFQTTLFEMCGFDTQDNFGGASMELFKIKELPYDTELVQVALEEAICSSNDHSPFSITEAFTQIYKRLVHPKTLDEEIAEVLAEDITQIWYQFSTFATHTFPQSETDVTEIVTEYPNNKLSIESVKGVPFGSVARIIVLYINSMAVKYRTREISIGKSIKEFVENLNYSPNYKKGKINEEVLNQLERLFHTTFILNQTNKTKTGEGEYTVEEESFRFHLFDSKFTWESIKNGLTEKAFAHVVLSEAYYKEILAHPVPISLETILALKKSPLAIDLYIFFCYRANANKFVFAKLSDLKKQFANTEENWRFKQSIERAIVYIKKAWPECNVILKDTSLIIPKMTPHIAQQKKK